MEIHERVDREINLLEIFWNILLSWRRIVCFGVFFAILISGMRYFLDTRAYRTLQNINIEEEKEELEDKEIEQLSNSIDLQKRIDEYENYLDKSTLMQIDPYKKPVVEQQYFIQSDYTINYTKDSQRDYTPELASMYCNYITGGELGKKVIEEAGLTVSLEDFVELISVGRAPGEDSGSIFLSISYPDTEKLEKISNVVKTLLEQKSAEWQQIGSHELKLIEESESIVVDASLAERKNTIANNITSLNAQLNVLKASMSSQLLTLFDLEMGQIRGEELKENEVPEFSIVYIILGAIIGFLLVCIWIVCKVIFTPKLQSAEEIRSLYRVRLLGVIKVSEQKKRFLSVIDNLIFRVRNRGRGEVSIDQQIKVISANVLLSCKQEGIDSIYITGSEYEKADKMILDKLRKEFSVHNIKVKDGGNMSYDAVSLQAGMEIGHILLVEQKGVSLYEEIYNELDLIKEYHSSILGVVVLDA
ncbi:hypothetical protein D3Z36_11680 [Lachnospiraceae bacterium]|nr:hypothetical protein [Lachnospiraceae bacterium]